MAKICKGWSWSGVLLAISVVGLTSCRGSHTVGSAALKDMQEAMILPDLVGVYKGHADPVGVLTTAEMASLAKFNQELATQTWTIRGDHSIWVRTADGKGDDSWGWSLDKDSIYFSPELTGGGNRFYRCKLTSTGDLLARVGFSNWVITFRKISSAPSR